MSDAAHRARRAASFLRYGAVQFLVLVPCAMVLYAGGTWWDPRASGYTFAHNFLSDLGMTHTFSGASNYPSSALFAVALVSLGLGLVVFAWTWRGFAFAHQRARLLGHASAVLGTSCGLAFAGIGLSPFDRLFYPHAVFVLAGFGLLPVYVATLAVMMWRNAVRGPLLAASVAYFVVVLAYLALILFGPTLATPHGHTVQVVGQKLVAGASILYILVLSSNVRRRARATLRTATLLVAVGCGSGSTPSRAAKPVRVDVWCGDQPTPLTITRDVKLDASTCGVAWTALELDGPRTTELVRALPEREVWVRRTTEHAFVEIRTRGDVSIIDPVTSIRWVRPGATRDATPALLTIASARATQQLTVRALKQRYGAATGRVSEISLCRLADDFADHPHTITVIGDDGATRRFTRDECEQQGAVLKLSGKGEVRLRLADGARVMRTVRRIEL